MEFVTEEPVQSTNSTVSEQIVSQKVRDDLYFVYSKGKGDNLPLTTMSVENKPCIDPSAVSYNSRFSTEFLFYPTEVDREIPDCPEIEHLNNKKHDDRFIDLGLSVSEYDVQQASGVSDILAR